MKKILFYLHFTKVGGAEIVAMEYMQGLINNGYKVDLIIDYDMGNEGNTFEYAIPKGIKFSYVKSQRVSKLIYKLRTLGKSNFLFNIPLLFIIKLSDFYYYHRTIKKMMLKNNYDLTITFFQFIPHYITKHVNIKHYIWLHGSINQMFSGKKGILKSSFGKKLDLYDNIFTIAEEMKYEVIRLYPFIKKNKIELFYNPFDFNKIKSKSLDDSYITENEKVLLKNKYICSVTRLDENQKDVTSLIKAYKILFNKNIIDHKLYIIGDGPDKLQLENLVKEYNLESNILFLGKKTNPFIWIENSDLFVLSSKFEGLPTVLIEAMILEKFIISSNCKTGPKEILANGNCGELFEIGNYEELSQKIYKSLSDSIFTKNKINKSINHVKRFENTNIINKFINKIEEK
jgi:glycosyltransferase involved in cell wall biosynthesis